VKVAAEAAEARRFAADYPRALQEFHDRAGIALESAQRYASWGWSVGPSCNRIRVCPEPDLHPPTSGVARGELWAMWAERPSWGVIAYCGWDMSALDIAADAELIADALERDGVRAPVAATSRGRALVLLREPKTGVCPPGYSQHHEAALRWRGGSRAWVPLPGAPQGGNVVWVREPEGLPLPAAEDAAMIVSTTLLDAP
jgi:hypothetical protein